MLPFRLRKDARLWFRGLEGTFKTDAILFEWFYFCVAAGLKHGRKRDVLDSDTDELVNYYPGEFKTRGRLLTGWLIAAELKDQGIAIQEKAQVHKCISNLVDPQSPSTLSANGVKKMNSYSSGGFELIFGKITDPPKSFPAFLIQFRKLVQSSAE